MTAPAATAAVVAKVTARPPSDRSWSIDEAAYVLDAGVTTVRELEAAGKLPSLPRFGRRLTFDPTVVEAFRVGGAAAAQLANAKLLRGAR